MKPILLTLNKKSFFRSSYWQKSLVIKIIVAFFAIYLSSSLLAMAFMLPKVLGKYFPNDNPILIFNQFIWLFFIVSGIVRQLAQELPVIEVLPLLIQPISKRKIAKYTINKSFLSFFNFIPWFLFIPVGFTLIGKEYSTIQVWGWITTLIGFVLIDHLMAIFIKRSAPGRQKTIYVLYILGITLFAISFFNLLPVAKWFGNFMIFVLNSPAVSIIPILLGIPLYFYNIKTIERDLYIDSGILPSDKKGKSFSFSWTSKLGDLGNYIALELKMITRNKRPQTALFSVIFLLLYGFIFYGKPGFKNQETMLFFIGIMVTGSFSLSYGQFTPAWHARYFPFLMTRNFGLKDLLNAQYFLFIASTFLALAFSTIYIMYGAKIFIINTIAAIFNIGFSSHLILFIGSFSSKPIDLSQSSFMNYQGTGASVWIMSLVIVACPMITFSIIKLLIGTYWALGVILFIGILGIILHNFLMSKIILKYKANKHRILYDYKQ